MAARGFFFFSLTTARPRRGIKPFPAPRPHTSHSLSLFSTLPNPSHTRTLSILQAHKAKKSKAYMVGEAVAGKMKGRRLAGHKGGDAEADGEAMVVVKVSGAGGRVSRVGEGVRG